MWRYFALGSMVFIASLLYFWPASFLLKYTPAELKIGQIGGSIWDGAATDVLYKKTPLGAVSWKLSPLCAFTFRLCTDIEQVHPDYQSQFHLKYSSGQLQIEELRANGKVEPLADALKAYGIIPNGTFEADFEKLLFEQRTPVSAQGQLILKTVSLGGNALVELGDINSTFTELEEYTLINVDGAGKDLSISGDIDYYPDARYSTNLLLRPTANSDETIQKGVRFFGTQNPDGSVQMKRSGKLN